MTGNELAKILFESVEKAQGYAFISDATEELNWTPEMVVSLAKNSREWTKESLKILNKFIRKYDEKQILSEKGEGYDNV